MHNRKELKQHSRYFYLVFGFFTMLFAGILYAWPILKAPLRAEFLWSESVLSVNFTLVMCFFCIGGLVAGSLSKKISHLVLHVSSAILIFCGFFIFSCYRGSSPLVLYLLYGIFLSLGIGIAYNVVISSVSSWFPDKKGFCSGVLMMGFGASSLILGNIASSLIAFPGFGWRATYVVIGASASVIVLAAGFFIHPAPSSVRPEESSNRSISSIPTNQMLRRTSFWMLFSFAVTNVGVGVAIVGGVKDIAFEFNASQTLATSLVGILSVCNGAGRIISGILFDAIGRRRVSVIGSIINISGPLLLLFAITKGSVTLGVMAICIAGLAYGFTPPLIPSTVLAFYGPEYFASNFSVCSLFLIPASFTSAITGQFVTASGNYRSSLIFLAALACISFFLNLTIKKEKT